MDLYLQSVTRAFAPACPARQTRCQKEDSPMLTSATPTRAVQVAPARQTNPFVRRHVLCVVLTVLNAIVVARFAGVLYLASSHHPLVQAGVTLLFAALLGSLARTWFVTLVHRPR